MSLSTLPKFFRIKIRVMNKHISFLFAATLLFISPLIVHSTDPAKGSSPSLEETRPDSSEITERDPESGKETDRDKPLWVCMNHDDRHAAFSHKEIKILQAKYGCQKFSILGSLSRSEVEKIEWSKDEISKTAREKFEAQMK